MTIVRDFIIGNNYHFKRTDTITKRTSPLPMMSPAVTAEPLSVMDQLVKKISEKSSFPAVHQRVRRWMTLQNLTLLWL